MATTISTSEGGHPCFFTFYIYIQSLLILKLLILPPTVLVYNYCEKFKHAYN